MFGMAKVMFIIVPILMGCILVFAVAMFLSPKLRGKLMSRQVKSVKYMMDESKNDITDIASAASGALLNAKKRIYDENEDVLRDLNTRQAKASRESVKITAQAIKEGLSGEKSYCKHCGALIDEDSKFCKKCGESQ